MDKKLNTVFNVFQHPYQKNVCNLLQKILGRSESTGSIGYLAKANNLKSQSIFTYNAAK